MAENPTYMQTYGISIVAFLVWNHRNAGYIITPANIADMDVAETLFQKMMDDYDEEIHPKYYIMDAGYDKPELYASIYKTFQGQAIVPINWRNTKIPPEGMNKEGHLVCTMNYPYVYGEMTMALFAYYVLMLVVNVIVL